MKGDDFTLDVYEEDEKKDFPLDLSKNYLSVTSIDIKDEHSSFDIEPRPGDNLSVEIKEESPEVSNKNLTSQADQTTDLRTENVTFLDRTTNSHYTTVQKTLNSKVVEPNSTNTNLLCNKKALKDSSTGNKEKKKRRSRNIISSKTQLNSSQTLNLGKKTNQTSLILKAQNHNNIPQINTPKIDHFISQNVTIVPSTQESPVIITFGITTQSQDKTTQSAPKVSSVDSNSQFGAKNQDNLKTQNHGRSCLEETSSKSKKLLLSKSSSEFFDTNPRVSAQKKGPKNDTLSKKIGNETSAGPNPPKQKIIDLFKRLVVDKDPGEQATIQNVLRCMLSSPHSHSSGSSRPDTITITPIPPQIPAKSGSSSEFQSPESHKNADIPCKSTSSSSEFQDPPLSIPKTKKAKRLNKRQIGGNEDLPIFLPISPDLLPALQSYVQKNKSTREKISIATDSDGRISRRKKTKANSANSKKPSGGTEAKKPRKRGKLDHKEALSPSKTASDETCVVSSSDPKKTLDNSTPVDSSSEDEYQEIRAEFQRKGKSKESNSNKAKVASSSNGPLEVSSQLKTAEQNCAVPKTPDKDSDTVICLSDSDKEDENEVVFVSQSFRKKEELVPIQIECKIENLIESVINEEGPSVSSSTQQNPPQSNRKRVNSNPQDSSPEKRRANVVQRRRQSRNQRSTNGEIVPNSVITNKQFSETYTTVTEFLDGVFNPDVPAATLPAFLGQVYAHNCGTIVFEKPDK